MKKKSKHAAQDDLRPEYDLRTLRLVAVGPKRKIPKRTVQRTARTGIVVLDPDVAAQFRTPKDVNDALRAMAGIMRLQRRPAKKRRSA